MGSVHIRISHNDDLMITELSNIKIFMDSCAESRDHGFDLGIGIDFIQSCLFNIQDLSSKRKDRLSGPASGGLGGIDALKKCCRKDDGTIPPEILALCDDVRSILGMESQDCPKLK